MNSFFSNKLSTTTTVNKSSMFSSFKRFLNRPIGQTAFGSMYVVSNETTPTIQTSSIFSFGPISDWEVHYLLLNN